MGGRPPRPQGSITLLVLVMFLVFVGIMTASLQFITRQSRQSTHHTQTRQAFAVADAGIEYAQWLLRSDGGNFSPTTLADSPPASATDYPLSDERGALVGTFSLTFTEATLTTLTVTSRGHDATRPDSCEQIVATLTEQNPGEYLVTAWDHQLTCPPT